MAVRPENGTSYDGTTALNNKYTYCGNNPINDCDPSGNITLPQLMTRIAIGTEVSATVRMLMGGALGAISGGADAYLRGERASTIAGSALTGGGFGALAGLVPVSFWATKFGKAVLLSGAGIAGWQVGEAINEENYALAVVRGIPVFASGALTRLFGGTIERLAFNRFLYARPADEQPGIIAAYWQMRRLGYQLVGADLRYRGSQGVDMVFMRNGEYAIVEAKTGQLFWNGMPRLRPDAKGLVQATPAWNADRLRNYLRFGDGEHNALAQTLLSESDAGRLRSFAAFYGEGKLYEIPSRFPQAQATSH